MSRHRRCHLYLLRKNSIPTHIQCFVLSFKNYSCNINTSVLQITWKISVPIVTWPWRALLIFRSTKNFTTCQLMEKNKSLMELMQLNNKEKILDRIKLRNLPLPLMTLKESNPQIYLPTSLLRITTSDTMYIFLDISNM